MLGFSRERENSLEREGALETRLNPSCLYEETPGSSPLPSAATAISHLSAQFLLPCLPHRLSVASP